MWMHRETSSRGQFSLTDGSTKSSSLPSFHRFHA
uniref:Uncharacterized protein n=1 Tax=Arundo donax TaxID=35708 RepID=A0A0A9APB0_ARUDO